VTARIRPGPWIAAYVLHVFAPLFWRPPSALAFATRAVAKAAKVRVPTRHGLVRAFIYAPPPDAPLPGGRGGLRPVHVQLHGGGFYGRFPAQDEHLARFIAAEVGAFVVTVDYDVAPFAQFPVAEEECYDVAAWVHATAAANGWDANCISVGGASAGGKLAINVCQLAYAIGHFRPCALVAAYAIADFTRTDRISVHGAAKITPAIQRLVNATYFADAARRAEPLASPLHDPNLAGALPPTLIMTGARDSLAPEMDALAVRLAAAGVPISHRQFADADHGFTHERPVERAREAIELIGEFLRQAFARCAVSATRDEEGVR
jgi:acetyl esterase